MRSVFRLMVLLLATQGSALFAGALEDARDSIIAGHVSEAMLPLMIGAIGVNAQDDEGYTLLHYAVKTGSLDGVTQLLDKGADPTIAAKNGDTALSLANIPEIKAAIVAAVPCPVEVAPTTH